MAKQQRWALMAGVVILLSGAFLPAQGVDPPKQPKKPAIPKKLNQPLVHPQADMPENPLERVIRSMRTAQERIANTKLDRKTRDLQRTIIKDLDQLIELAQQTQSRKSLAPSHQQPKPQPSPNKQPEKPRQPSPQPGNADPSRSNPEDSTEQIRQGKDKNVKRRPKQPLVNEVWGHLPEQLRAKLRIDYNSGRYLKRYEDLVRRYFRALAEDGRQTKRGRSSFRD